MLCAGGELVSSWFGVVWEPWSGNEVLERCFDLSLGMWCRVTDLGSECLSRASFSERGSYVNINRRGTGFPVVYDITPFGGEDIFFLMWQRGF